MIFYKDHDINNLKYLIGVVKEIKKSKKIEAFKRSCSHVGHDTKLSLGTVNDPQNIRIGDSCFIGTGFRFFASGGITIGDATIISTNCTVHTSNHVYQDASHLPYGRKTILKSVKIGNHVWIGDNVMICPGVIVGDGSIIGMGSVVTKNIPKLSVVGGNPATIIKSRNDIDSYERNVRNKNYYLKSKSITNLSE